MFGVSTRVANFFGMDERNCDGLIKRTHGLEGGRDGLLGGLALERMRDVRQASVPQGVGFRV